MNALIRFYFKVDPAELSDEQFAICWNDLKFVLDFESERNGQKAL